MKKLVLLFMVVLAGCATATQVKGPNGEDAYQVQCGKAAKEKCAEKAARLCPRGYNILERNADPYADQTTIGSAGMLQIKADTTMIMLIQCK